METLINKIESSKNVRTRVLGWGKWGVGKEGKKKVIHPEPANMASEEDEIKIVGNNLQIMQPTRFKYKFNQINCPGGDTGGFFRHVLPQLSRACNSELL
jgi:hypothetical protein